MGRAMLCSRLPALLAALALLAVWGPPAGASDQAEAPRYVGSAVCAGCHPGQYER